MSRTPANLRTLTDLKIRLLNHRVAHRPMRRLVAAAALGFATCATVPAHADRVYATGQVIEIGGDFHDQCEVDDVIRPGPTNDAKDDDAREQLFTLFNLPRIHVLSGKVAYTQPIRAHELRIIGPVTIKSRPDGGDGRAQGVEIDAFVVRFIGLDASLTIDATGTDVTAPKGANLSLPGNHSTLGGRIDLRIGRVTYDAAAIKGMLARRKALDAIRWVDQSAEAVAGRNAAVEAMIKNDPKGALLKYFLQAENRHGTTRYWVGDELTSGGGWGFQFGPFSMKHVSHYFDAATDRDYVRQLDGFLGKLQTGFNERLRTRDYGALYGDLIRYNSLPSFSPAVNDPEFNRMSGEINSLRDKVGPLYAANLTFKGPSGVDQTALLFYDLNDRAHPRLGPTHLLLSPQHGADERSHLGSITVNADETVTIRVESTLQSDPFVQARVATRLRQDKDERLEGTFANWTIVDGHLEVPGIRASRCTALGLKVSCEITFERDAAMTSLLALGSSFGLPLKLHWRYAGQMPPGMTPAEGEVEVPFSLLRQNELSFGFAPGQLRNLSALPVDVEYLARAGGGFEPLPVVLNIAASATAALAGVPAGQYSVPATAAYVAPTDPLALLGRFKPFDNSPLLDWVRIANYLPLKPLADARDELVAVDLNVEYGTPGAKATKAVRLTPVKTTGSTVYLDFLRRPGAAIAVTGVAKYKNRGDLPLKIDTSSFSVIVNEDSILTH